MQRYFRLLGIFYKNTLINEVEYRLNFWSNIALSLFWLVWAALGVRVYFFHTDSIAGWSYFELLVVMGLFFTMNGYRQMLLTPNLSKLSSYVRLGTLDYILTKPIDSQFMVSLRNIGVHNWGDPLMGLGLVVYAFWQMKRLPAAGDVLLFFLLILAAMILLYSFTLLLQTSTFWLVNVERMDTIIQGLLETGRFPNNFYRGALRSLLTFIVPVAFMTTFPAMALLGRLSPVTAFAAFAFAILFFLLSRWFWNYALKFYTGASS